MATFGILVKSFREDAPAAKRLFDSLRRFNSDDLPIWVVVPDADVSVFTNMTQGLCEVIPESALEEHLVSEPVAGIRPGYINQEIVKLAFWEMGIADNYLPVDSDAVFLRPFGINDFMFAQDVPYTVLLEDRELQMDPDYYASHWQGREAILRRIQQQVGLNDSRLLTCHGHQVLSSMVLRSLSEEYLKPRDWSYARMLEEGPYEFSWYNFWLQKSKIMPIEIREPYFKVIHSKEQHADLAIRGVTTSDIARGYLGVIVNSNFSDSRGELSIESSRARVLATYLSWPTLVSTAFTKIGFRFVRSMK